MTDLHYLDPNPSGQPAVLLLHGLGADGNSWSLQIPELVKAGYRPLAPDAPGFGRSPYDGRGWSFKRIAAGLAGLLEELCTGPVHVIGLSMGGVIAQQFAFDNPHLVRKLVLASTFSVLRPDNLSEWFYFLRRLVVVNTLGLPAQAKVVAERVFPQPHYAPLREMLVAAILQADPRAYRRAMFSLGAFDSRRRLRELKTGVLIITGADDSTVSPSRQKLLASAISGSTQIVIPHAGHAVPVDQPEIFNRSVLKFLQE